ncbi:MAG: hypothetical protein ACLGHY_10875, partial [Gammaproteobacteria bacterium]
PSPCPWRRCKEAGGYSAHFDGSPYLPGDLSGGLICATDRLSWELAREALMGPTQALGPVSA